MQLIPSSSRNDHAWSPQLWRIVLLALLWALGLGAATAQVTNAFDQAADPTYDGQGGPDGLGAGGQNGGYGFGPWSFSLTGTGGSFIQTYGPSGRSFNLWNLSANNSTVAVRTFGTPLTAGQSFSVDLRLNSLDNNQTTNMLALQDANGNTVFAYWHTGNEPNPDNGSYLDATTSAGVAANFTYAYQQFKRFTFTLNSPTTYTFSDATTGASFTGTISAAPIVQVAFIRANANHGPGNGQDFQFDRLQITSASPATFQAVTPAPNALSVPRDTSISLQILAGSILLNPASVTMKLDGASVTPTVTGSASVLSVSFTPGAPLAYQSAHTVQVVVQDENTTAYTNTWTFKTGNAALPVTLAGPFTTGGGVDFPIFTAAGEGWLGTNYDVNSSRTLYVRFSMAFHDLNGEVSNDGSGGCYGGLHFFQNNNERLLLGQTWRRNTWSIDTKAGGDAGEPSLIPEYTTVVDEWRTVVARIDYAVGGAATVRVWLDPDFSQTEVNQPLPPLEVAMNNAFNNIRLRCGNGTANATWTNIIVGAFATDVGFQVAAAPQFQGYIPAVNAANVPPATPIAVEAVFGSYAIAANNVTLTLDGVDVTPSVTVNPNSVSLSYQPPVPFAPGSVHTAVVNVVDANAAAYATSWSFTVDAYPALPVVLAESTNGTVDVFGGGAGQAIWTAQNGWLGAKYGADSTNTLYTRFTMNFLDLNAETGGGGGFGGLHFFRGNNEVFLIGNNWGSLNWSVDHQNLGPDPDLLPITPIQLGEWRTVVVKTVFVPNANDQVSIWLSPDFNLPENQQPEAPLTFSGDCTFDAVRVRAGNGSAYAQFTNIVIAATSTGVGFPAPLAPAVLSLVPAGSNLNLSWTGAGTLQEATAITGPWTDAADQSNPQTRAATGSARFFRIKQ